MRNINVKKKVLIAAAIILALISIFAYITGRPITGKEAEKMIQSLLDKAVVNEEVNGAVMLVYSDQLKFDKTFHSGTKGKRLIPLNESVQFHAASVGKTFSATIIGMLENNGDLSYTDKISSFLDDSILINLFVYEQIDYSDSVTIEQLLSHTSGIADYFEDPVSEGKTIKQKVLSDPGYLWTPAELLEFTSRYQHAVAKPGDIMHYSDSGYILLGFIIEKITEKSYWQVLDELILKPLEMNNTYLLFNSEKNTVDDGEIMDLLFEGNNLTGSNALSIDWTGGGIVSTTSELLTFYKAFNNGRLVNDQTIGKMTDFRNKYLKGIYYGMGMMQFRFKEFSPLLSGMGNLEGGVGASSAFMLYDSVSGTYLIGNFGSIDYMEKSVETLLKIMMILKRIRS